MATYLEMGRQLPEGCIARFEHWRYLEDDVIAALESLPERYTHDDFLAAQASLRARAVKTYADKEAAAGILSQTGGVTIAHVFERPTVTGGDDMREIATGEAYCSMLDPFSRKLGRTISLGRALLELEKRGATA